MGYVRIIAGPAGGPRDATFSDPIPDPIPSVYLMEIDHWSISKRYVSSWGAILKKIVVFKKENTLRPMFLVIMLSYHFEIDHWSISK